MTICPLAIVAGCSRCPIVKLCPAKGIIGNYQASDAEPAQADNDGAAGGD